ncbi:MAG: hypothetical protein ACYCRD_09335 [Leptospirillum sp.]
MNFRFHHHKANLAVQTETCLRWASRRPQRSPVCLPFVSFLLCCFMVLSAPNPASALDLQFLGDLTIAPVSPLQNAGIVGGGGDIRVLWEVLPDWDAAISAGIQVFPTSTNPGPNTVTFQPNTSGIASVVPVTFGFSHVIYRTSKKNTFFLTGGIGPGFEFSYGANHPEIEPYAEVGGGFSLKEFFLEERLGVMPLAFGAYQPAQSGTLIMFITSIGIHFFKF